MSGLSKMNITEAALFPDLVGVGQSVHEILSSQIAMTGPVEDWTRSPRKSAGYLPSSCMAPDTHQRLRRHSQRCRIN